MKTIFETDRLVLREIDPETDAPFFLELINEPNFIRYVADRGVRTADAAADYIREKIHPSYQKHGFGFYLVELKNPREPVGICGLVRREGMADVDVGFSMAGRYWSRGYAYEAASALMEWGRNVHGLTRITGLVHPDNAASIRLLEKLGLHFERTVKMPGYDGDTCLFAKNAN